jgi:hypothetical protein
MMRKKDNSSEDQIKESVKEKQVLLVKNIKNIEETKTLEKIFSGSCCHSGIHTYNPKKKI